MSDAAALPRVASKSRSITIAILVAAVVIVGAIAALRAFRGRGGANGVNPAPGPVTPHVAPRPPAGAKNAETAEIMQMLVVFVGDDGRPLHRADGAWVTRTKSEAKTIASSVLERVRAGERFESLVLKYTDDVDEKGQPTNGATVSIARGVTPMNKEVEAAVFSTKVGSMHETAIDAGRAFLVFRRDR